VAGTEKNGTPAGAAWAELASYVAEQLWSGKSAQQVVNDLQERGLAYAAARSLVESVEDELRRGGAL